MKKKFLISRSKSRGFPRSRFWHLNSQKRILGQSHMPKFTTGFTLIELLVTIIIFVTLTSAILIKNSKFKNDLLITNIAYEIALAIRQAQVYGINVEGGGGLNPNYQFAYGVHFDIGNGGNTEQFVLFVDSDENYNYKPDGTESEGTTFKLRGGNKIVDICVKNPGNSPIISCNKTDLDITFKRPDPEAVIRSGGIDSGKAQIKIDSPSGGSLRVIEVTNTGQISVLPF